MNGFARQRLVQAREVLRKVGRDTKQLGAIPAPALHELRTLAEDCEIQLSTIQQDLTNVQGLATKDDGGMMKDEI